MKIKFKADYQLPVQTADRYSFSPPQGHFKLGINRNSNLASTKKHSKKVQI